jgi:secreted trypsin-like serine protease
MRRLVLLLATVLAVLVPALPATAITGGVPDGTAHPSVGGLVSPTQYSDGTWLYCSGTLISSRVFLTAAHCGEDEERVGVTFDTAYQAGDPVHYGTFQADPLYGHRQNDPHDIAVVVLDSAVRDLTPSLLPEAGSLSSLSAGQPITSVGYGAYEVTRGPGGHTYLYDDVRMRSTGSLHSVTPAWLRVSMNPATGDGGTCYGDSGGPNFLDDTDVIAAITITGDAVCRATNVDYRLDTGSARSFLDDYVALP